MSDVIPLDADGTLVSRVRTLMSLPLPDSRVTGTLDELTVGALLRWYDAGCGSGSHLAETLGMPPSQSLRELANILTCASESQDVKRMLGELAG